MDKDELARLQAQRLHLVAALATIDKALEALPPMTRHGERARLTGKMQASLAALGAVNAQMASLGRLGCRDVAAVP
jgi:hypothetical protein